MNFFLNLIILAGIAAVANAQSSVDAKAAAKKCSNVNEVYLSCGSGCGDLTCEVQSFAAVSCPKICIAGCYCKPGYVRNAAKVCVLPKSCPPKCKANEVYTECGSGCGDLTCEKQSPPKICPDVCKVGCICKPGYVRNAAGLCVLPSSCPPICKANEVYTECGSGCGDLTCERQSLANIMCPAVCKIGCVCKPGYVRNAAGLCVLPSSCPSKECPVNEVYTDCGSGCGDLTCEKQSFLFCPAVCKVGCFCAPGYVRNAAGVCILVKECPSRCPVNEYYTECGNGCGDYTCEKQSYVICPAMCNIGCVCNEGYVRNAAGLCILPINCPPRACPVNQDYSTCGTACEPTCANPLPGLCIQLCKVGCFCRAGFVKAPNGDCVLFSNCPKP